MSEVIDRLIDEVRQQRADQAEEQLFGPKRRQVAGHFGIDVGAVGRITQMHESPHGLEYEITFTDDKTGDEIRAMLQRESVKPISFSGINLYPGDTITLSPTLTFHDLLADSLHWDVERTRQLPPDWNRWAQLHQVGAISRNELRLHLNEWTAR